MNPFLVLVASGQLRSVDDLRAYYKAEVKRLHPDLQTSAGPAVDFDQFKKYYVEAVASLEALTTPEAESGPEPPEPVTQEAVLDEFRELVARGFPVNVQAASKNRAYTASIRRLTKMLGDEFSDPDFFPRVNREARVLKRHHPRAHWYVLQVFWSLGDWRLTGYDSYRRISLRHLDFVRETLVEGFPTLLTLLDSLVA